MLTPDDFTLSLADPTRLRILVLLTRIDELCVCQLAEAIDVLQPKMSRHLSILRKKDILLDRRDGLWVFYRLHPELPRSLSEN
jgi:ArsR family transcriptional regulator